MPLAASCSIGILRFAQLDWLTVTRRYRSPAMCQFFETYHEYSGCKLNEQLPNGKPSGFSALLKGVKNYVTGPSSQDADAPAEERRFHLIKYKTVILCPKAAALRHREEEDRICPGPDNIGHDREHSGVTTVKEDCPVCEAVEQAVAEAVRTASNQTFIVSEIEL